MKSIYFFGCRKRYWISWEISGLILLIPSMSKSRKYLKYSHKRVLPFPFSFINLCLYTIRSFWPTDWKHDEYNKINCKLNMNRNYVAINGKWRFNRKRNKLINIKQFLAHYHHCCITMIRQSQIHFVRSIIFAGQCLHYYYYYHYHYYY